MVNIILCKVKGTPQMATISEYLILKPYALVPENTVKSPNLHMLHLAGYCQNTLTYLF